MVSYCQHYVDPDGDDENFLLDDENTKKQNCVRCRKQISVWSSNDFVESSSNPNWGENCNGSMHQIGYENCIVTGTDDLVDSPEDSPLLINDCYKEPSDEFHCHSILSNHEDSVAWKKLASASIFCFLFMIAEIIGGYLAGSLAIMTDAAHLFSDFIGFLISLLSIWIGRKNPTKYMTFGYHRAEVLGALLSVMTMWILATIFSILAIRRMIKKEYEIEPDTMIVIASLGLAVNIVMGAILHGVCHNQLHSHGSHSHHSHSSDNINVRAAVAHVLGDLLQSFGVLIAAIVIKTCPNSEVADPICTLIFSFIVIGTTVRVAKDSLWHLLEGSPKNSTELAEELYKLSNVKHVHSLHIWSLAPGKDAVAVHLAVDRFCDKDLVLKKATSLIRNHFSLVSCTIQLEAYNSDLINSCKQCQYLKC